MSTKVNYKIHAQNEYCESKKCRYQLIRQWNSAMPQYGIIMFNPREVNPIPFILGQTLGRITQFVAKECGSISVVNLFAYTSKTKAGLKKTEKKFEKTNFTYIKKTIESSKIFILFWGDGGSAVSRNKQFISLLQKNSHKLRCFGVTKKSQPMYLRTLGEFHPLLKCTIHDNGDIAII